MRRIGSRALRGVAVLAVVVLVGRGIALLARSAPHWSIWLGCAGGTVFLAIVAVVGGSAAQDSDDCDSEG